MTTSTPPTPPDKAPKPTFVPHQQPKGLRQSRTPGVEIPSEDLIGAAEKKRVLIIRLGALGDLIVCFQAFHEIREAHKTAEIVLLTAPEYADFARSMPWFNRVMI